MSAFIGFVFRALNICSDDSTLKAELLYIKSVAVDRGFNPQIVDSAVKKFCRPKFPSFLMSKEDFQSRDLCLLPFVPKLSSKISGILRRFNIRTVLIPPNSIQFSNLKDEIPLSLSWGIYQIPCQCGKSYIGQTRRALKFRINEHKNYVKNQELTKSAIAQHCWQYDHLFQFDNTKLLQKMRSPLELDFYEAFHIFSNLPNLVNDSKSIPHLSLAWKRLIDC
jgi:hypothetical protein